MSICGGHLQSKYYSLWPFHSVIKPPVGDSIISVTACVDQLSVCDQVHGTLGRTNKRIMYVCTLNIRLYVSYLFKFICQ